MGKKRRPVHKILHITPHLGGGVGRVVLNYLDAVKTDPDFKHSVICLDYANEQAKEASRRTAFSLKDCMSQNTPSLLADVGSSDVVLIHWWNHPLLYALLVREDFPPSRIIFWSHISGFHAPYVFPPAAFRFPDLFAFTTPISLDTPEVLALSDAERAKLRVIWSTGGIDSFSLIRPVPHAGFNIGYIGTVDYCKLHPRFLAMSSRIRIPGACFTVCGGPGEKVLQAESAAFRGSERFCFTGQVRDVWKQLAEFDVFGYPLAPYHYGTCEQALAESMAAGVPPVVMNNRAEVQMVRDGKTGIVASDEKSYILGIELLYADPDLRKRLARNAHNHAFRHYSMDKMEEKWEMAFAEALRLPKRPRRWTGRFQGRSVAPHRVFLESLGKHTLPFETSLAAVSQPQIRQARVRINKLAKSSCLWQSQTRGSPKHYSFFFPGDSHLTRWSNWISIK